MAKTMDKEFVTYEQALALKELGFKEECFKWYHNSDLLTDDEVFLIYNNDNELFAFAPLKQQVFRWFREKHNWIGGIRQLSQSGNGMIIGEFRKDEDNNFMMFAETYDKCENNCINELIEIAKQQDVSQGEYDNIQAGN